MIEYTSTPDFYNEYIAHYGVKGMKWRKGRKTPIVTVSKSRVKKGETEMARLHRLNPASARARAALKPMTTADTTTKAKAASEISGSSKKSGKGGSKKAVKDILSRFKLTKSSGGKKAAEKKESTGKKAAAEKKESTGSKKAAAEKKESSSKAAQTEKREKVQEQPKIVEKVSEDYLKYLERQQQKVNESKLTSEDIKKRIEIDDEKKKRRGLGVRKIYTRS